MYFSRFPQILINNHHHFGCKQSCILFVVDFSEYFPQYSSIAYEFPYSSSCVSGCDIGEVEETEFGDLHSSYIFAHFCVVFKVCDNEVGALLRTTKIRLFLHIHKFLQPFITMVLRAHRKPPGLLFGRNFSNYHGSSHGGLLCILQTVGIMDIIGREGTRWDGGGHHRTLVVSDTKNSLKIIWDVHKFFVPL